MTHRLRATLLIAAAAMLLFAPATFAVDSGRALDSPAPSAMETGKRLYRKYCGQCHSLTVALAAGFGSNNGLGTDGGPSFETLRVPFNLSVLAITQPFIGHEPTTSMAEPVVLSRLERKVELHVMASYPQERRFVTTKKAR